MIPDSPYKGLVPFEDSELDALFFFGRERETGLVTANLMAARLTVLYGPIGVGKSSLLRAGVAHGLREQARASVTVGGRPEFGVVVFSTWRDEPIAGIRAATEACARTLLDGAEPPTPETPLEQVGCSYSAGMFADFFGRVADAPLAVMEVECRSAGGQRCRFLLGSADVMQAVYDGMSQGLGYEDAVSASA